MISVPERSNYGSYADYALAALGYALLFESSNGAFVDTVVNRVTGLSSGADSVRFSSVSSRSAGSRQDGFGVELRGELINSKSGDVSSDDDGVFRTSSASSQGSGDDSERGRRVSRSVSAGCARGPNYHRNFVTRQRRKGARAERERLISEESIENRDLAAKLKKLKLERLIREEESKIRDSKLSVPAEVAKHIRVAEECAKFPPSPAAEWAKETARAFADSVAYTVKKEDLPDIKSFRAFNPDPDFFSKHLTFQSSGSTKMVASDSVASHEIGGGKKFKAMNENRYANKSRQENYVPYDNRITDERNKRSSSLGFDVVKLGNVRRILTKDGRIADYDGKAYTSETADKWMQIRWKDLEMFHGKDYDVYQVASACDRSAGEVNKFNDLQKQFKFSHYKLIGNCGNTNIHNMKRS